MFDNFFSEGRSICEIIWKNVMEPKRLHDNIIRRMRFACWIVKATDTHSEYVIHISLPRQQRLRERASILRLLLRHVDWPDAAATADFVLFNKG